MNRALDPILMREAELDNRIRRIAVHVKQKRFDEAAAAFAALPEELAQHPKAMEAHLRYLMASGKTLAAAKMAAQYFHWKDITPTLVETAMAALLEARQPLIALDIAEAVGPELSERINRLTLKISRAELDQILDRFDREGVAALETLTGPVIREDRHRRTLLRKIILRTRKDNDLPTLAEALTAMIRARPDLLEERIQLIAALLQLGSNDHAAEVAGNFPPNILDRPEVAKARLQAFLRARKDTAAAEIAQTLLVKNSLAPDLLRLALIALLRMGYTGEAHHMVEAHIGEEPSEPLMELRIRAAYEHGELELAGTLAQRALDQGMDTAAIRNVLAHLHLDSADRESAERHHRSALAANPDDLQNMLRLSELLLVRGDADEALELLERAKGIAPQQRLIHMLMGRAAKIRGDHSAAADHFQNAVVLTPNDTTLLRQTAASLKQAGREEDATQLFEHSLHIREKGMPDHLEQGLQDLWDKAKTHQIPQARLDWAWSLSRLKNDVSREDWEIRAKWGNLADRLLFDWLEVRTDRADEAMALFIGLDDLDKCLNLLRDEGRGLVMASAHVGPLFAGPLSLELLNFKAKWLASTPSLGKMLYRDMLISTSDQSETQVVRATNKALNENYAIGIAVDGAPNLTAPRILFERQEITYSSYISRLAYKRGVVTCYAAPRWENGSLRILIHRLPDPQAGENQTNFVERWKSAYLGILRSELSGEPENLRLGGGVWRHIR